ncbi:hypothetical protein Tco_0538094, partial [Tanacetum coccineum]
MRPFGCPVTILNTIDHLGKFDGKADEGFFVGYSLNSSGPDWLFDIDALIRTMNYEPIVTDYILLSLWTADPPFSQDPKSSHDDGSKPSSDDGKKVNEDPRKDSKCKDQEKEYNVNSTNNVNTAGNVNTISSTVNVAAINEVNVVGGKTSIELPFDPNMTALEDDSIFDFLRDDEDDGASADMNQIGIQQSKKNPKRNINNEMGIVKRNKARLDAQSVAFTRRKDFVVYQMDVKILFSMRKIKEECITVIDTYKLLELGMKTLSTYLLEQWVSKGKIDKPLCHPKAQRSMTGSLMYLTSSRPNIGFAVCAYARYQVNPKVSHLYAMKRIF